VQKLLLIERDDGFTSIFRRYFVAGGYEVVCTRSVEETLAKWRAGAPDLVVADSRVMDDAGPRFRGALRRQADKADVKIVASGTWADKTLLAEATETWADDSFSRPCHPEKIWDIIKRYLGQVDGPKVRIDLSRFSGKTAKRVNERPFDPADHVLDDIEYLMYEVSGNLVKTRERLVNQIEKRMRAREVTTLADYDALLRRDPEELTDLVGLVTVNETYFFRSPDQFTALRETVFPKLGAAASDRAVRVWSAACSVGAEPYSIAMLAREALPDVRIRIVGSDIDARALERARKGVFSAHMVERTPLEYKGVFGRYAEKRDDGTWQITRDVRDMVTFKHENILESQNSGFDLVFCRNVMIYFDQTNVTRMVTTLTSSLRPGGILAVGDSEYVACETNGLERLRDTRSTFFVRNGAAGRARMRLE